MLSLLFALISMASAQDRITDHNAHGWYNYFGDHPVREGSKWGVHLEGQYRRADVITAWQQLLLRPGINYTVNDHLMLTGGYCFVETWPYGDYPFTPGRFPEHRLWQQAQMRFKASKVTFTTRLRFENRWLGNARNSDFRYEHRFRALQRITVPVRGKAYFTAYDEFWVYVKPYVSNSAFDQNRAYAAIGYSPHRNLSLELGYMNQAVLQRSGRVLESNHTFMLSIISNKPFGKR